MAAQILIDAISQHRFNPPQSASTLIDPMSCCFRVTINRGCIAQMNKTSQAVHIVFCVDRGAVTGLHVTIGTLLSSLSPASSVVLHVLHSGLTDHDFCSLQRTIDRSGVDERCALKATPVDVTGMEQFSSHVGHGWVTYARLLAPGILKQDRLIYLDADLLVYADLSELWHHDLQSAPVGAVSWTTTENSNDHRFYSFHGLPLDGPYFNAGVLLFDCHQWVQDEWTSRCIEYGNRYSTNLPSADQTMLNLALGDVFTQIPRRFNTPVTASRAELGPRDLKNRVIHLVSRPKPWDAMGWLNGQSRHFDTALADTDVPDYRRPLPRIRDLRMSKMYAKCLQARLPAKN